MRQSQLFGRTVREVPADAQLPSHQLLVRAGLIRQLSSGLYTALPLAQRSIHKIERIIREEMDAIGGQEINMPLVHPAELWEESGRYGALVGRELAGFTDRAGRPMVLAMTHEESVTFHARNEIRSYRQLPLMVYQIKLKFRDEPRPRAGLIRVREFTMKDAYSFHESQEDLERYYREVYDAYSRIFTRAGVPTVVVESDPGMIGGTGAHEFMLVTPSGEDNLILCDACGYTANAEVAVCDKGPAEFGDPLPSELVETPGTTTISEVAALLGISERQTMKAVFYVAGEQFVFAVLRGDLDVNETKLRNRLGVAEIRPARDEEIRAHGVTPGYASPIGARDTVIVVDDSVRDMTNGVAGANRDGYHLRNVNFPRDFAADVLADIALVEDGCACARCGGRLRAARGIEVGNIFRLGTKYSEAMEAVYLDAEGRTRPLIMGCYGIGVGRLLASAVEASYDADGIIFPYSIAPYHVHLLHVGKGDEAAQVAESLYREWTAEGVEVLYDDRDESPGVKFKDSDLIGLPVRVTVSERTLKQDAYEVKLRTEADREVVPRDGFRLAPYLERARVNSERRAST
ncbi:proline--tRNA ligase [Candidatus Poribacteria bacterium]|nr:proline--tRNA ligase [Candidatus Poribacteria bacterium]